MRKLILVSVVLTASLLLLGLEFSAMNMTSKPEEFMIVPLGSPISDERVDGYVGLEHMDAEFEDVELMTEDGSIFAGILFRKHDLEYLYVGIQVWIDQVLRDLEVFIAMDSNRNNVLFDQGDNIDDLLVEESQGRPVSEGVDFSYIADLQFAPDADFGGSDDVVAGATFSAGVLTAEFKRPLDSGDAVGNDPRLVLDDQLLIGIGFVGVGSEIEARWDGRINISPLTSSKKFIAGGTAKLGVNKAKDITIPAGAKRVHVTLIKGGPIEIQTGTTRTGFKTRGRIDRVTSTVNYSVTPGQTLRIKTSHASAEFSWSFWTK